jgi:hypothetical protein
MGAHGSLFARRGNKSRHIVRFIGVEYYDNLGPGRHEQLYAVTDFKLGECDVELGIGSHAAIGPSRHQSHHWLCIPGSREKQCRRSADNIDKPVGATFVGRTGRGASDVRPLIVRFLCGEDD